MTSIFSNPIFILDALRTPIGSPYKNFKDLTAAQLAALAFQKLYSHQNFKKDLISEMILGNGEPADSIHARLSRKDLMVPLTIKSFQRSEIFFVLRSLSSFALFIEHLPLKDSKSTIY